jgi:hypothetical protein
MIHHVEEANILGGISNLVGHGLSVFNLVTKNTSDVDYWYFLEGRCLVRVDLVLGTRVQCHNPGHLLSGSGGLRHSDVLSGPGDNM